MKKAITLLETVFVLVIVGILAAVMLPRIKGNSLQEAATQLISDIKYTQHLALVDDKYNPNDSNWYQRRWQIMFGKNVKSDKKWAYTIFSDTAGSATGDASENEIAKNPINPNQRMTGGYTGAKVLDYNDKSFIGMKRLNLGATYAIDNITFTCGQRIAFDHLGRPMFGDQSTMSGSYHSSKSRLIKKKCYITLKKSTQSIRISIEPETGYVSIE